MEKIRAIVTGATGMVGEGVLHECLLSPHVESVLVINRKPCGVVHPKLKEIIHADFFDLSAIETQLSGYNACYFCLGVSSVGMKEPEYYKLTYSLTMHVAETLSGLNPDMVFCYVSGGGTDSTEKGRVMWARVKGKTENDLMKLPFKKVFNFRPGYMHPTKGLKNVLPYYKYITWLYPFFKIVLPNMVSTLAELGLAMINVTVFGYEKQILEVKDIKVVAHLED
ncbi:NAD-dependent epimerase/dehydratase family protein [Mucilaginibacter sp. BJC16-A38]|uniref:NAD-dependent epimerase/dehydratase family protein n=1 Tax=Mucilaginibacter phenanthrenivorans TaxID=1234842 RepID=UPI0021574D37|nr:NAD-dependent epimerase/dehydratase family protein [Mucilaginibacter phenanthrenivorans]MCR8558583.1 NAD-dependent epimerase/dehydratase family protein [Mucilaginibacter phenanthrenivorans]